MLLFFLHENEIKTLFQITVLFISIRWTLCEGFYQFSILNVIQNVKLFLKMLNYYFVRQKLKVMCQNMKRFVQSVVEKGH